MAIEMRRIFLSLRELVEATHSYLRANVEIIGAVHVTTVHLGKDGEMTVNFVRDTLPDSPPGDVELHGEHVVSLLVRFCHENNIPLPRHGRKSVVTNGNSLALQVKIGDLQAVENAGDGDAVKTDNVHSIRSA